MKCKSYYNSNIDHLLFGFKDNIIRTVVWFRKNENFINMLYDVIFQIKDLGLDENNLS